jgi:hypothetical protein
MGNDSGFICETLSLLFSQSVTDFHPITLPDFTSPLTYFNSFVAPICRRKPQVMDKKTLIFALTLVLVLASATVEAGPAAYGVCQAGCAAVVMACYAAGGATWGATLVS